MSKAIVAASASGPGFLDNLMSLFGNFFGWAFTLFGPFLTSLASWVFLAVLIGSFFYIYRYPLIFMWRELRRAVFRTGTMHWFRMIPESRSNASSVRSIQDQQAAIESLRSALNYGQEIAFPARRTMSILAEVEPNGMGSLYIGADKFDKSIESAIYATAANLDYRIEPSDPPEINTDGMVTAFRNQIQRTNIVSEPHKAGRVLPSLARAGTSGTFLVSLDFPRKSEMNRVSAEMGENTVRDMGMKMIGGSSFIDRPEIFTSTTLRGSMVAASANGDPGASASIMGSATSAMSTLGQELDVKPINSYHLVGDVTWTAIIAALGIAGSIFAGIPWWLSIGGIALALLGTVLCAIKSPIATDWWHEQTVKRHGEVIVPSYFSISLRWFLQGVFNANRQAGSKSLDADKNGGTSLVTAWPTFSQCIYFYSSPLTELLGQDKNSASRGNVSSERLPMVNWPSALNKSSTRNDVLLGYTPNWKGLVTIGVDDLNFPMYVAGAPGSGKTNLLQTAFATAAWQSEHNTAGMQMTCLWSETKGEGAKDSWDLVKHIKGAKLAEVHNPKSPNRLALEGKRLIDGAHPDEVIESIGTLVDAMQFAYGDGIRSAAKEALVYSMRVAALLSPDEIVKLELPVKNPQRPNIVALAYDILDASNATADYSAKLVGFYNELVNSESLDEREDKLADALHFVVPYIDRKGDRYRSMTERKASALNKLSEIKTAQWMFEPTEGRGELMVEDIVHSFAPIVLNFGPYLDDSGERYVSGVSESVSRKVSLMFSYALWTYVNAHCSGWGGQNKRVIAFFDEVADIAVDSDSTDVPNVIAQSSKQGRSKGFSLWVASQNPKQLPAQARNEVLGFRTVIWYGIPDSENAEIAMRNIGENSDFSIENIRNIPMRSGLSIARVKKGDTVTDPFTLRTPYAPTWAKNLNEKGDLYEAAIVTREQLKAADRKRFREQQDGRRAGRPPQQRREVRRGNRRELANRRR
jgi:hypothetical protein